MTTDTIFFNSLVVPIHHNKKFVGVVASAHVSKGSRTLNGYEEFILAVENVSEDDLCLHAFEILEAWAEDEQFCGPTTLGTFSCENGKAVNNFKPLFSNYMTVNKRQTAIDEWSNGKKNLRNRLIRFGRRKYESMTREKTPYEAALEMTYPEAVKKIAEQVAEVETFVKPEIPVTIEPVEVTETVEVVEPSVQQKKSIVGKVISWFK